MIKLFKRIWKRVPYLPDFFDDLAHGRSYVACECPVCFKRQMVDTVQKCRRCNNLVIAACDEVES